MTGLGRESSSSGPLVGERHLAGTHEFVHVHYRAPYPVICIHRHEGAINRAPRVVLIEITD